jgi:hypothetical protein
VHFASIWTCAAPRLIYFKLHGTGRFKGMTSTLHTGDVAPLGSMEPPLSLRPIPASAVHVHTHCTKADQKSAQLQVLPRLFCVLGVPSPKFRICTCDNVTQNIKDHRVLPFSSFTFYFFFTALFFPSHRSKDDVIAAPTDITLLSALAFPKYSGQRKDVLLKLIPIVVRETVTRPCPCEEHFWCGLQPLW